MFKTYSLSHRNVDKRWLIIDATNLVVGRVASIIAKLLRGKHKVTFTPHIDCGDHVIVINARHIKLTGNKADRKDGKFYYRHSGYPGGIKRTTAGAILEGSQPELVLKHAVTRMLTRKNKISAKQLGHLYIYPDGEHKHAAQQPTPFDVGALNRKNKVS
jgi:large subunit ribosomal protein L13